MPLLLYFIILIISYSKRGGAKIRSLSSATNTKIDVSPIVTGTASHGCAGPLGAFSPDLQRPVAITGTLLGCTKCICEILSAIFCDTITNATSGLLEHELSRKKSLDEKKPQANMNDIPQASYKEVLNRQQPAEFLSTEEERVKEPIKGCSLDKDASTSYRTLNNDDLSSYGLRDLVDLKCCKHIDIGAAVMPCLLFDENAKDGYVYVDTVPAKKSTRYAEVLNKEFNAVVSRTGQINSFSQVYCLYLFIPKAHASFQLIYFAYHNLPSFLGD